MIRLMIADDPNASREMLLHSFTAQSDIEVVGVAKDGPEAVAMVEKLRPDIILMDVDLPRLNGYEASRIIMDKTPTPILLMSATWDIKEVDKIVKNMHIGILGVYERPFGSGHPKYKELYEKIAEDVKVLSDVKVIRHFDSDLKTLKPSFDLTQKLSHNSECSVVLIGASTGGPSVLLSILKSLEADYPLPMIIAQHMSRDFIDTFIEWLDEECKVHVKKAQDGEKLSAGNVYIAPADHHISLQNRKIKLIKADESDTYVPSISRLFASVSKIDAPKTIAVLLSGMGDDGAEEIARLKHAGAITVAQDKETSVVFGMAHEAIKNGGIGVVLPPEGIAKFLVSLKTDEKGKR